MTKLAEISSDSVDEVSEHDHIKKFGKQMLKNSLFVGTFQEKRFVEPLNSYRNVISIAREEENFITNLMAVKKRINEGFPKKPWIGITEPNTIGAPVGYNLWVTLSEEVFGKFWYKVKTIEFLQNEIRLRLEVIRPVKNDCSPFRSSSTEEPSILDNFNLKAALEDLSVSFKYQLIYFYTTILTLYNIKQSVIFISLLIGTIIAGGVNIIKYLLEYLLKLLNEVSGLIKAVTPIMITCVNLIGRSILGFYHMIVALYRGKQRNQPIYNSYYSIEPQQFMFSDPKERYNQYFNNRQLPYYPPRPISGVKITPLDN